METSLRNTLRLTITACRRMLEEDYLLQLEGRYGIRADGSMEPLASLQHLDATGKAERLSIDASLQHERIQEKDLPRAEWLEAEEARLASARIDARIANPSPIRCPSSASSSIESTSPS